MNAPEKILRIRERMRDRLCILGHYYQRDEIIGHADFVGDSLELARRAAASGNAEKIVFCGVHFMAESARVLAGASQAVYMPAPGAGCPMADMAPLREVLRAWDDLSTFGGKWVPVAYVNSSAKIKAFCGERGGATCTSSNAAKVFSWALKQDRKILFLPDEHLGANTAFDLGLPDDAVAVYNPSLPAGGIDAGRAARASVLAWKGYCHVHMFSALDIRNAREKYPGSMIIVHPETPKEALRLADAHGSTSQIARYVEAAPSGSTVIVGTEINLVRRLAALHGGRVAVHPLRASACRNMAMTNEDGLLALLENWPRENEINVAPELKAGAALALQRMLEIS